jgi:hypothetical protein
VLECASEKKSLLGSYLSDSVGKVKGNTYNNDASGKGVYGWNNQEGLDDGVSSPASSGVSGAYNSIGLTAAAF